MPRPKQGRDHDVDHPSGLWARLKHLSIQGKER